MKKEKSVKTNEVSTSSNMEVKYQGTSIPIKNEKLKYNFNKIEELTKKVGEEQELNKKMNIYTDIFNIIDEISKIIKKDKADETNQPSAESKNTYKFRYSKNLHKASKLRPKFKNKKIY